MDSSHKWKQVNNNNKKSNNIIINIFYYIDVACPFNTKIVLKQGNREDR